MKIFITDNKEVLNISLYDILKHLDQIESYSWFINFIEGEGKDSIDILSIEENINNNIDEKYSLDELNKLLSNFLFLNELDLKGVFMNSNINIQLIDRSFWIVETNELYFLKKIKNVTNFKVSYE